jgi:nicotinamidase-related amidase
LLTAVPGLFPLVLQMRWLKFTLLAHSGNQMADPSFQTAMGSFQSASHDLHGSAPDHCPVALILIDVINDLDFEGNEAILEVAPRMARAIAELKRRAKAVGVPVIYVNDNFGRWQSDFRKQVEHCLNDGVPGAEIVRLLQPKSDDYFVLKPKHSGFYSTTLDTLALLR